MSKIRDIDLLTPGIPCSYYYVKSYAEGSGVIHLAAGIV